ncbi:hypothetical protein LCGC14_1413320 [marine sediment metagenome]|uniref:PD-(D/E)XK endonuclease-like domain-containing protein n=1 Tax=marine sediment metagenome TaxID=412755 RepID=A0A0F9M8Y3_9ZZZZ|nr:hypothetical protein [Candidatus Aminicenantes bacterium]
MEELVFIEETHEYFYKGFLKPSVTQIINEYLPIEIHGERFYVNRFNGATIPGYIFERAGQFGSDIHRAIKYLLGSEGLNYDALDPSYLPVIAQFDLWRDKYDPEIILCEEPMYSMKNDYCGTLDLICIIKKLGKVLLDFKTGYYDMIAVQLSAYEKLYRENYKDQSLLKHYVLHLPKNGEDYYFGEIFDRTAWPEFQALQTDYQFQRRLST